MQVRNASASTEGARNQTPKSDYEERIRHLEKLVVAALEKDKSSPAVTSSSPRSEVSSGDLHSSSSQEDNIADRLGRLKIDESETTYVGSEHWISILHEV